MNFKNVFLTALVTIGTAAALKMYAPSSIKRYL